MKRVALALLACLFCLTTAAIIPLDAADVEATTDCLYEDELWGTEDGTKYYFCLPDNSSAIMQSCPTDTFFVRNETVTGCIPLSMMSSNCVYNGTVGSCTGENLKQPQPNLEPTKFYLCTSEGATPLALSCADGKAFVKQDGYLGCFDWAVWRNLRQCYTLTNQKSE